MGLKTTTKKIADFTRGLVEGMASETAEITKGVVSGMGKELKQRFSAENITGSIFGGGPMAKRMAKSMFGKEDSNSAEIKKGKSNKFQEFMRDTESQQTQYLASIDDRLKELQLSFDLMFDKATVDKYKKSKQPSLIQRVLPGKLGGQKENEGFNFGAIAQMVAPMIGTALKMLGGAAKIGGGVLGAYSAYGDAKDAGKKKDQWGIKNDGVAEIAGFLGGTGEGIGNAAKKALEGGAMGLMIAGPLGGVIGALLGAIGGYFGGEKIAKVFDNAFEIAKTAITDSLSWIGDNFKQGLAKINDVQQDIEDFVASTIKNIELTIKGVFANILGSIQEKFGSLLETIGSIPGLGKLKEIGSNLTASGQAKRDDAENSRRAWEEEKTAYDKKKSDYRASRDFSYAQTQAPEPVKPTMVATVPTKSPKQSKGVQINPDMSVGSINGSDITAAANFASKIGDPNVVVPPEALAAVVAKESGGDSKVGAGDGGKSVGITQMKQIALDQVNKMYGTNFTQEMIKNNTNAALQAAALYLKWNLSRSGNDLNKAIAGYNGSGPMAQSYAQDVSSKIESFKTASAPPTISPVPKTSGSTVASVSGQNKAMQDQANSQKSGGAPVVVSNNTNVENKSTINMPIPPSNNQEQSFSRLSQMNWILGA
jgi:hypothetical protein